MSNLIVISQSFPCMFVGFMVRVECESLVNNCEERRTLRLAYEWTIRERPPKKHMLEAEESSARRHLAIHLASHLTTRPTHKMTREMHCQVVLMCFPNFFTHTIKAHITYEIVRKLPERKP